MDCNQHKEYDQVLKIIFVGPPGAGKSCLINGFTPSYKNTIGVDFAQKKYKIGEKCIRFEQWDISASMTFNNKNLQHCKNGQIVACVYSVNEPNSFKECQNMIQMLVKDNKIRYDAKFAVIANKNDLPILVQQHEGLEVAYILKGDSLLPTANNFLQVSAKNTKNVNQLLCKSFYQIWKDPNIKVATQIYQPDEPAPSEPVKVAYEQPKSTAPVHKQYSHLCKILLMGDDQTGKSSILNRYVKGTFLEEYLPTIGVDFAVKTINVHEHDATKLQIWDTAGMQKFKAITACYINGCHVILVVYDCSNLQSFYNLGKHIETINKQVQTPEARVKYIVANKIDKDNLISMQEGKKYAQSIGYGFAEVSALQDIGINQLFSNCAESYVNNLALPQ